jgi:serine phosphatase RsbU (regulator of sigma subunit)
MMSLIAYHFILPGFARTMRYAFAIPVFESDNVVSLSIIKTIIIFLLVLIALITLSYLLIREILNLKRLKKAFEEIDMQREELQIRNKDLTDSLTYARRIQTALLPTPSMISKLFSDYFILYRPKHIVSGDFYWVSQDGDRLYLAAADCTGHGVPGALMSMIGLEILQKIINESRTEHSDQILDELNKELESAFNRDEIGEAAIKDGMEMSMCIINTKTRLLEYSGAFLPIYIARDEKLIEIKGDKINVGQSIVDVHFSMNTQQIEPGDIIYLFSDGYADQFGGPENKKFMYRRLRHLLVTISKFPMQDQQRILEETIVSWMADTDQIDDIMVMGFRPF